MFKKQNKATTETFIETYNKIWQNGPAIKYQNPEGQVRDRTIAFSF